MVDGLFKNKHRIKSARMEGHDYSQDGWYFVTICTGGKQHFFGEIIDSEMVLNQSGIMVEKGVHHVLRNDNYTVF